jgi:hypothetical protein
MISLRDILLEDDNKIYKGLVRVTYSDEGSVMDVADVIRAIKGVTIVNTAGNEEGRNISMYDVKIRSKADPQSAFQFIRQEAMKDPIVKRFEVATKTIERA